MWEGISRPGNGKDGIDGKKPLIFDTRKYPGGRTKVSREPGGTPRSRQIIKNRNITKNRNLLKSLLIINPSIIVGF